MQSIRYLMIHTILLKLYYNTIISLFKKSAHKSNLYIKYCKKLQSHARYSINILLFHYKGLICRDYIKTKLVT